MKIMTLHFATKKCRKKSNPSILLALDLLREHRNQTVNTQFLVQQVEQATEF